MSLMKPIPLHVAQWLCLLGGAGGLIALAIAPLDYHIYVLGARNVGGKEFLSVVGLPYGMAVASFALAGVGLSFDHGWSRLALLGTAFAYCGTMAWAGVVAYDPTMVLNAEIGMPIAVGVAAWYLFGNRRANAYYASLRNVTSGA